MTQRFQSKWQNGIQLVNIGEVDQKKPYIEHWREEKVIGLQCGQSHADAAADRNSWRKMDSTLCISLDAGGQ